LLLLEQKNKKQMGIGGIQKFFSLVCEKRTEDKDFPEEWKLVKQSKKVFTEWKQGESHKIFMLGTDISPYNTLRKYWEELSPESADLFIDMFNWISKKIKNIDLLVAGYGDTLFSVSMVHKIIDYLFYSIIWELINFVECLENQKDCSGNPMFQALSEKSVEHRELIKDFVVTIIQELQKEDNLFKDRIENLNTMIEKNKEEEKQDLLAFGRNVDEDEKVLDEMFSRIGVNRRLEKYSQARVDTRQVTEDPDEIMLNEHVEQQAVEQNEEFQVNDIDNNAYDVEQLAEDDTNE